MYIYIYMYVYNSVTDFLDSELVVAAESLLCI